MYQEKGFFTKIGPNFKIFKILNGMWQVSGAHGLINRNEALNSMESFVKNGYITWDLADHYGPAEDFVKAFRDNLINEGKENLLKDVKFLTKWVPSPQKITKKIVESAINISRTRMGMDILDMVQFHWWDYDDKNYLKAIEYLDELRTAGIIKTLGLTNFDTAHLEEFINMGIKIVSNQVQYSIIDRRPEILMQEFCEKNNVKLLAYGTLGGGFLSKRYLNVPEPPFNALRTASLYKYKKMIDRWGNWQLLCRISPCTSNHNLGIFNVQSQKYRPQTPYSRPSLPF